MLFNDFCDSGKVHLCLGMSVGQSGQFLLSKALQIGFVNADMPGLLSCSSNIYYDAVQ